MTDETQLPSMETMLEDLAKVDGLGLFWMAAQLAGQLGILTDREAEIVQNKTQLSGETANSASENGPVMDSDNPRKPAP